MRGNHGPTLGSGAAVLEQHSPYFACHSALAMALYLVDILLNSAIEFGDITGRSAEHTENTVLSMYDDSSYM